MNEVELVRRIYEQAASGGLEAVAELVDTDIEWAAGIDPAAGPA